MPATEREWAKACAKIHHLVQRIALTTKVQEVVDMLQAYCRAAITRMAGFDGLAVCTDGGEPVSPDDTLAKVIAVHPHLYRHGVVHLYYTLTASTS